MDNRPETVALSDEECLALLPTVPVGRVVFTEGGLPAVHPVNFAMHGRVVVLRTGTGAKLDAARRGEVLAFEVDHVDPETRSGWSVLVVGHASVVYDVDRLVAMLDHRHRPWVRGRGGHVVQIVAERITGRRLALDSGAA